MKRLILAFLFLFGISANAAEFSMPTYESPLLEVEDGYATIMNSPDIAVGSSGVVMHKFANGDRSIVARAVVAEKMGNLAKVRFEVFDSLEQKALPLPKVLPSKGDIVILNFLYNRALLVVPNAEIYEQIVAAFPNITFIHPDLAGAHLSYNFKPNPSRDDFRKMCSNNAAGLIFIALDKESLFADCGSFEPLKTFASGEVSYYQIPFYSRVGKIDTMFFDVLNGQINDYDRHYRYLLGQKSGN
ncbi:MULTISPECIES: plasminogen-binding N-terminal domain-containing protein [unclassified Campylobacter]|uniref:plasminogen-binding N-terminal domain-containing protein n=1 Tax=unclassified Campylobacter TaxID=2593542 RepID=UPI0022E9DCA0|nr:MULTISPECIES: plasminogen-binding N-terminal domain-containing protein [unclassified Campylobacter]MDA3079785.1 plasminogen-binding N-terminal domain-containing protein [Campylobacter sp. CS_NA2]MDA3081455.1 plasminogen-binding N-terminal domain-containing protein [Campylobacter sp. CS_NA1]MDA3085882.1 plasminogen-binding N-terminal domain-containing protein [Campylobacter sp. CS_ED1]MDA3090617.1 plasminogen-binding N-terminal domain-containing protein [Campylobacter sp. CS_ED2]WBR50605.1 p